MRKVTPFKNHQKTNFMKRVNHIITTLIFSLLLVLNPLFAAQRMGLVSGGSASIPPKGSSELPARCMDESADPPTTYTDYSQVMNADPKSVSVRIDGKTISMQEALNKGYISISGTTVPRPGTFRARIDAVKIINNTNKRIDIKVNKPAILGESHHKPFSYDPASLLNSRNGQRSVWDRQAAIERRAQQRKENTQHQSTLKSLGEYKGNADGNTQATKGAIKEFQKKHGIPQTGKFDDATKGKVDALYKQEVSRFEEVYEKSRLLGKEVSSNISKYSEPKVKLDKYCRDFQRKQGLEENGIPNNVTKSRLSTYDRELQNQINEYGKTLERLGYKSSNQTSFGEAVSNFQRNNSINRSRVLDEPTRKAITKEIDNYKNKFEILDFRKSKDVQLEQSINSYQKSKSLQQNGTLDKSTRESINREIKDIENTLETLGYSKSSQIPLNDVIKNFQKDKAIKSNGVFNSETKKAVNRDIDELNTKFDYVIGQGKGDFKGNIEYYQRVKGLYEGGNATKKLRRELERDFKEGNFITSNGKIVKTAEVFIGNDVKPLRCIKLQSGIYSEFSSENIRKINLLSNQLSRKYASGDIKILSFVKDTRTEKRITELFFENNIKFKFKSNKKLERQLKKNRGKTVFVVGHIENGKFVTYSSGKEIYQISIKELMSMGERTGVRIFPFGCNSAKYSKSGINKPLRSYRDTEDLIKAIKNNNKIGDALSEFAGKKYKFIIDENTFKGTDYAQLSIYKESIINGKSSLVLTGILIAPISELGDFGGGDDDDDEQENP